MFIQDESMYLLLCTVYTCIYVYIYGKGSFAWCNKQNTVYVQKRDINEVFDRHFVSHWTMNNMCSELNTCVLEIMETSPVRR